MRGRSAAIALACAAALVVPAAAHAGDFDQLLKEYQSTGKIDGCKHSAAQLEQAKGQMPNDIARRAPGFPAALDLAVATRAKGGCDTQAVAATTATSAATSATAPAATTAATTATGATGAAATTQAAPAAPATVAQPAATTSTPAPQADPQPAASTASASSSGVPVALVIVGALVLLGLALWGLARWWAWEPPWLVRWRHATAEAGWRASAAWAEFTDWLRLGR